MLLAALVLAAAVDSGPPSQPQYGPTKVASLNGWELTVRPSNPNGLHGADYILRSPAKGPATGVRWGADSEPRTIAWQGPRVWTLRNPVVSDRGWTYGHGVVNRSSAPLRDAGTTYIVALDADGKARIEDHFSDTRDGPSVVGLIPFEASNTLVVRIALRAAHPSLQELWFYEIDGTKRAVRTVFPLVCNENGYPTAYTDTTGVVAVRGAPLLLVHGLQNFSDRPSGWSGARDRWALFDLNGERVWSLDDEKDPVISDLGKSVDAFRSRRDSVTSTKPGEFETLAFRTHERVTYAVTLDPTSKVWSVVEKSREPVKSGKAAKK